ncbi:MAG: ferrous iron transport protein B [Muribaculaceae bacterium]|nr:ferrous iron transport protein B [Muribaculaceae bacterium]
MNNTVKLSQLLPGDTCVVSKVHGHGAFRKRVLEMGIIKGRPIQVLLQAPLNDPVKYRVMDYEVSLRRSEADLIEVTEVTDPQQKHELVSTGTVLCDETLQTIGSHSHKVINVALIGNPNCGKTSLFNIASGAKEHVGNYSGVTVDAKTGHFRYNGYRFNFVDLPGTYSLASYSPEELYVREYLRDESADIILNVVDASNLERNLYLTTELIDMDRRVVIALNMYDELRRRGDELDYEALGRMIGVPMVPVIARTGEGVNKLLDTVIATFEGKHSDVRHVHVSLGPDMEAAVRKLIDRLKECENMHHHFSPRYVAIKLLEGDTMSEKMVRNLKEGTTILELRDILRKHLEDMTQQDISADIAANKYGFIAGALAETFMPGNKESNQSTRIMDALATSKLLGFPLFIAIMCFIFWATFYIGQYPMDWIESGVSALSLLTHSYLSAGPVRDMIADGIIGGVGGVIVFLPNILILYFCISFMEDSGYMARAAFIMDKLMHKIGLHGKSFIPLVMGFGCNVPAITASRAIESKSSRLITILINPFMSCSARLPIYVLMVGTFFPAHASLVFIGLYLTGILMAVITAKLLRKSLFKKDETPFVMELPPYRVPTLKASLRHTWGKGEQYLKKMGGPILIASILVWALNYFPRPADIHDTNGAAQQETVSNDSYLYRIGKAVTPVLEPLGFNWKATVAAVAGVPAKEIVVSTLGVLYTGDEATAESTLAERLKADNGESSEASNDGFTSASALSFLVFILLYCPCTATVTAIARETGSWRWSAFSVFYNTAVAWLASWLVFTVTRMIL